MIGAAIFVVLALLGLKLAPSYIEFFQAKKAIVALAQEKQAASWPSPLTTTALCSIRSI